MTLLKNHCIKYFLLYDFLGFDFEVKKGMKKMKKVMEKEKKKLAKEAKAMEKKLLKKAKKKVSPFHRKGLANFSSCVNISS